jgi:hypothetical protein
MKGIVHIYSTEKQTELLDYYCAYMVYAIALFAVVHSKDSLPRKNNLLTRCLSLLNIIKTLLILIYKIPYYGIAMLLRLSVEHWTCFWPKWPKPICVLTYKRREMEES